MTKVQRVADVTWSALSSCVTTVLFGVFLFWVVLQQPDWGVQASSSITTYKAQPGSVVYLESPLRYLGDKAEVTLYPTLHSKDKGLSYNLTPIHQAETTITRAPATAKGETNSGFMSRPVYPLQIPQYVEKGTYTYQAEARYVMNVLREAAVDLPSVLIVVE